MPKQKKNGNKKEGKKLFKSNKAMRKDQTRFLSWKEFRGKAIILTEDLPSDVTFAEEIICGRKLNTFN